MTKPTHEKLGNYLGEGGGTQDYTKHIIDSIENIYSLFSTVHKDFVMHKFTLMIQNTLSDRAPGNHCVSQELNKMLDKALVELYCNLHPLDGLAAGARKIL